MLQSQAVAPALPSSLLRAALAVLVRTAALIVFGIMVGALAGGGVEGVRRIVGQPVITGSASFASELAAGPMPAVRQGLVVGLFVGGAVSNLAAVIAVLIGMLRHGKVSIGGRLVGIGSGGLTALFVASGRECAASWSGGVSELEWRIVNSQMDFLIFAVSGGMLGFILGAFLDGWIGRQRKYLPGAHWLDESQ